MRHLDDGRAVRVVLVLFTGSWLGQFFSQLARSRSEQQTPNEPFGVGGSLARAFPQHVRDSYKTTDLVAYVNAVLDVPTAPAMVAETVPGAQEGRSHRSPFSRSAT